MRLFFALWPPAEAARALSAWAKAVQQGAGGRATAEATIHLTLAFLGDADPARAAAASRRVRGRSFELPIDAAKYWKHNKIVWVGPAAMPVALQALVKDLHESLRSDGFVLEDRPFTAHITLVRKAGAPASIPPLPEVRWPVAEFVLVRSIPGTGGSRYDPVERFPLGR
ncbi:MAG: RNA 2',3'-cyclic phosphodiesterase [Clostridia bacterium]